MFKNERFCEKMDVGNEEQLFHFYPSSNRYD